jgi:quinolinate synthase
LGHHYQRDDVICHSDLQGDSFKLSEQASQRPEAEYIVFCGVHFMAESADILSAPSPAGDPAPDLAAGCSMADMASLDQVETAWEQLRLDWHR